MLLIIDCCCKSSLSCSVYSTSFTFVMHVLIMSWNVFLDCFVLSSRLYCRFWLFYFIRCSLLCMYLLVWVLLWHEFCYGGVVNPTSSLKPLPLPSLHISFTPNWKHCSLANPILIHCFPHTSLPVSTPSTIHHSRLTVCLPAWLSGSWPLPIDFVLVKRLWISWFLRFCGRSWNQEFTITMYMWIPSLISVVQPSCSFPSGHLFSATHWISNMLSCQWGVTLAKASYTQPLLDTLCFVLMVLQESL